MFYLILSVMKRYQLDINIVDSRNENSDSLQVVSCLRFECGSLDLIEMNLKCIVHSLDNYDFNPDYYLFVNVYDFKSLKLSYFSITCTSAGFVVHRSAISNFNGDCSSFDVPFDDFQLS